jgi:hypothetical protein
MAQFRSFLLAFSILIVALISKNEANKRINFNWLRDKPESNIKSIYDADELYRIKELYCFTLINDSESWASLKDSIKKNCASLLNSVYRENSEFTNRNRKFFSLYMNKNNHRTLDEPLSFNELHSNSKGFKYGK